MTKREATGQLCVGECGSACCRTPHMILRVREDEAARMTLLARKKKIRLPQFRVLLRDVYGPLLGLTMGRGGRCVFLQHATGLCRIYAARPNCCRTFPHEPFPGCLVWPDTSPTPKHAPVGPGVPRPFEREESA